jgi:hypothetical protein
MSPSHSFEPDGGPVEGLITGPVVEQASPDDPHPRPGPDPFERPLRGAPDAGDDGVLVAAELADLDPALPGLARAFDRRAVAHLVEHRWGHAPGRVRSRGIHHASYEPGLRCVVVHDVEIAGSDADPAEVTFIVVVVGPDGLSLRSYREDPDLPWLIPATEPTSAAQLLDRFGLSSRRTPQVTPVRYRAGSRCLLRFDFDAQALRRSVFGKVIAGDAVSLHDSLRGSLSGAQEGAGWAPILRPIGCVPDLHMLLSPGLDGTEPLSSLLFKKPLRRSLAAAQAAGVALASLHLAPLPDSPRRRFGHEVDRLFGLSSAVGAAAPGLIGAFTEAVRRLANVRDAEEVVAGHGSFRTDQVLVHRGKVILTDLDSFGRAHPAADLGNFLAYLRWKAIREPRRAAFVAASRRGFLEGYGFGLELPERRWLDRYEAASLLKIAGRRFRALDVGEWPLVPELIEHAHLLLDRAGTSASARWTVPSKDGPATVLQASRGARSRGQDREWMR